MPIHDWTRVSAGTFHAFHLSWMSELREALNRGILPADYYAQAKQIAAPPGQDILAPQAGANSAMIEGGRLVMAPTGARFAAADEKGYYARKRRELVIRRVRDDEPVALIELVSPGNKAAKHALRSFVEKAVEVLYRGYHLLVVDLFPPGPRDPQGIHGAIWAEISDDPFELPPGEPLTLAAYSAGPVKRYYVEPTAVGQALPDMPLFLEPEIYVNVPLEATYQAAYRGVPRRWRQVLEAPNPPEVRS